MNNKILLVTLSSCKTCKETKRALDEYGIAYKEISCEEDPSVCDELESLTNTSRYPMAIVKNLTQKNDTIYFITNDYNQIGKENRIDDKVNTIGVFSSHGIINSILNQQK